MQTKRKNAIIVAFALVLLSIPTLFYFLRFIIVFILPQSIFDRLLVQYVNSVALSLAENNYDINYKYYFYSFTLLSIKYIEVDKNKAIFCYQRRNEHFVIKRIKGSSDEDAIMSRLNHVNIVKTHKTFRTVYKQNEYGWIVMEYLDFDINFEYVKANQKIIKNIALDILNAINYLHDYKIAHLDIKIENIMGKNTKNGVVYKLIDFGYSKYVYTDHIIINNKNLGTFPYKPPEIVFDSCHTLKSDIWSFGASLYYLLINDFMFFDDNECFMFEKYKDFLSNDKFNYRLIEFTKFYEIVKQCMTKDYKNRPTVKNVINMANACL